MFSGSAPVATVATALGDSAPVVGLTSYWEMRSCVSSTTYALRPSGVTATPNGDPAVTTLAGVFGVSAPVVGSTSNW